VVWVRTGHETSKADECDAKHQADTRLAASLVEHEQQELEEPEVEQ
jgi:hypothetical protein